LIIDAHGHVSIPAAAYQYQSGLVGGRGTPPAFVRPKRLANEQLAPSLESHLANLDSRGIDVQLISPRPFMMLHSMRPESVSRVWTAYVNDLIAQQCAMSGGRLAGVGGLPQYRDSSPAGCLEELERCVGELGFVGALINPDPMEGECPPPPGLGDPFWYALYEKLVELDVPALVHSTSCCSPRESYTLHFLGEESIAIISLLESNVFGEFPDLKLVISHGGGAIPYQMGRFRAWRSRYPDQEPFDTALRRLWFDTCNYSAEALELLFKVVGADRCLFGTEAPGTGSVLDPESGRHYDDLRPVIEGLEAITDEERRLIFEGNVRALYGRLDPLLESAGRLSRA
jgi:4-oxalmesaconate hydratase